MIGGLFISADGSRRLVPDQWFHQAELSNNAELLRLGYTFGTVEVSGRSLDIIFEDAAAGRLGVVVAVYGDAPASGLWVANIVYLPQSATPIAASEKDCLDA
jgi:hypothetical protein